MRKTGLIALTTLISSSAWAVPAPPQCPWEFQAYTLLQFQSGQPVMPLNGSFWIRDYSEIAGQSFSIVDVETNTRVPATEIRTPVLQVEGSLVQLKPDQLLEPNKDYQVQVGDPPMPVFGSQLVRTGTATDDQAPEPPTVSQVVANTDPYTVCSFAGVVVYYDLSDPNESLLILAEDRDGGLLELGTNPSSTTLYSAVAIPTDPNETVDARLVAVDLAGNRSDAVDFNGTAGAVPVVTGKIPVDDGNPFGPDGQIGDGGGCDCRAAGEGSALPALLLIAPLLWWRRRVRR